jgi:outer membrane protein OmpA-like peptidoglycan-associated protein/tetratricopeptide (TPR) repeat protein
MKMKNILLLVFVSLFITVFNTVSTAQVDVSINKKEFKHKKAGYKDAWKAVKSGDEFYSINSTGGYKQALEFYEEGIRYNADNAELNYKIGVCYLFNSQMNKAVEHLVKAYQQNANVAYDVKYLTGKALQNSYKFEEAIKEYSDFVNQFQGSGDKNFDSQILAKAKRKIEECNNGINYLKTPARVFIDNLGPAINSSSQEYGPVITADESMLVFTSRREGTTGGMRDEADYMFYEDLYVSYKDNQDRWGNAINMRDLNTEGHDASIGLSYDGQILYTYNGTPNGTILQSELDGSKWTKPKELSRHINTKAHETSASVSADTKILYFVSDREKDDYGTPSYGGKDIYYCLKTEKGDWGKVTNIGKPINTEYNEEACFIHPDGVTMYFSSEGHSSMGEYDIFKIRKDSLGNWGTPENLGYPVNTPAKDVFFVMAGNGRYGYYSTERENGYGGQDIYRITFLGPEKLMVQAVEDNLMASLNATISDKIVEEEVQIETVRLTLLKGTVTDAISGEPIKADIEIVDNEKNEVVSMTNSNSSTGKYMISLPSGKNYGISVKAEGYLFHSENFNIPATTGYQEVIKDVILSKVGVGTKIVLKNIFFDFNKSTLRPESYPELSRLQKLMESYPSMRVEIGGHTDNKGSLKYNTDLSEARAKAVVDYLVEIGIDRSRLEYKGYAYLEPIDTNDTDEGRQNNRRVEFKVLSVK